MKLEVKCNFKWYIPFTEEDIQIAMEEDEITRKEVLQRERQFQLDEIIGRLEGCLDNQYAKDWSNSVEMKWIED